MDKDSLPDFILLTHPENNTRSIDYSDRSAAVLWGDCSSALVISTKMPSPYVVTETSFHSSPKNWKKVGFPIAGHFRQDGRTVQTFAIKRSLSLIREMREHIPGEKADRVKFIGHQANLMMLNSVCNLAEIKPENHLYNVDMFGNCGAAGAASVLSQNWGRFTPGDFITFTIVGAGLSWAALLIEVRS
jgi:3-oxoacyl-[acyl-carrier-protein] synthase-3